MLIGFGEGGGKYSSMMDGLRERSSKRQNNNKVKRVDVLGVYIS